MSLMTIKVAHLAYFNSSVDLRKVFEVDGRKIACS